MRIRETQRGLRVSPSERQRTDDRSDRNTPITLCVCVCESRCHQCLQNVGFFGPHHVPIWEKHMQTCRVSVSALLHAAVTSFV